MDTIYKDHQLARESVLYAKRHFKQKLVTVAEIGVAHGLNALSIYKEFNIKNLYLIDTWDTNYRPEVYDWMIKTCQRFNHCINVHIMKMNSLHAVNLFKNNLFDFVYLDGNHNPEHVKREIEAWLPKLNYRGIIAGHDYIPGGVRVTKAVNEIFDGKVRYKQNRQDKVCDWWKVIRDYRRSL